MATIFSEFAVDAPAEQVWAALAAAGEAHSAFAGVLSGLGHGQRRMVRLRRRVPRRSSSRCTFSPRRKRPSRRRLRYSASRAARLPHAPDELAKHNCLCTAALPWGDEWRLAGKRGEVRVAVGGSFRSNSAEMLRAAALDGIGIAVLPTWAVGEPLRAGALRRVLEAWEPPASTIYAVYPGNRLLSMKVRAFVDYLARCIGRTPYWDEGL